MLQIELRFEHVHELAHAAVWCPAEQLQFSHEIPIQLELDLVGERGVDVVEERF